jgi:hypothetical protein
MDGWVSALTLKHQRTTGEHAYLASASKQLGIHIEPISNNNARATSI